MRLTYFQKSEVMVGQRDPLPHNYRFRTPGLVRAEVFQEVIDWSVERYGPAIDWVKSRWAHAHWNNIHSRYLFHNHDYAYEGNYTRLVVFRDEPDAFHFRMRWC